MVRSKCYYLASWTFSPVNNWRVQMEYDDVLILKKLKKTSELVEGIFDGKDGLGEITTNQGLYTLTKKSPIHGESECAICVVFLLLTETPLSFVYFMSCLLKVGNNVLLLTGLP
ncbi:hypothetical protein PanWU01x14_132840 [Parasponia andersonii]|uniref:Uncharacterized protein n=1 Tax=Parasponia andersonii TaxID=3476 RepID=A0A2P5CQ79_PARAD|nr:hypothetical protein PanWU01x14_132840 [Parasponia andersonii]